MKIIKNVRLRGELVSIAVENGKIKEIIKGECNFDAPGVDFGGAKIYPGLIDVHSHGAIGLDTMDGALNELGRYYLENGTTTWYPTTMTMSTEDIISALLAEYDGKGANIPGFHLEGPFINPDFCGAQDPKYASALDLDHFAKFSNVKMVTIAPELEGAEEFIRGCGAVVSIGHSSADYDTAMRAFEAGATCLTHTFNRMAPIHHRKPGPIPAGADAGAYAQLICDGIHTHPSIVRMLVALYGDERVVLISDSMSGAGLSDGEYTLGGQAVTVKDGVATISNGDIAGSTVTLLECVRRAISFGIPEESAVKMASENPARLMGLNKGKIEVGYDADFIIVDNDFGLVRAIARGEI